MFGKKKTDVAIVGAGPVGLMAALRMAKRGVRPEVYDKGLRHSVHSYALALHPRSLDLMAECGIERDLVESGHRIDQVRLFDGDDEKAVINLNALPGQHPFVLVVPQSLLEEILERRLKDLEVPIHWNHRIAGAEFGDDSVRLNVEKLGKESLGYPIMRTDWIVTKAFDIDAKYVIGADGYFSLIRRRAKIEIDDRAEPKRFAVFEMNSDLTWDHESRVRFDTHGTTVFWPMADGRCRLGFQVQPSDEEPGEGALEELVARSAPWFDLDRCELLWSTAVEFRPRLARTFGQKRCWIAGDAAHLTSPAGVQSMNIGLREAHRLAGSIATVVNGEGSPEVLDQYSDRYHSEWSRLLGEGGGYRPTVDADPWISDQLENIVSSVPVSGGDQERALSTIGIELKADAVTR